MRGQERELCGLAYIVGVSLISKAVPRTHGEVDPLKGLTLAMGCFFRRAECRPGQPHRVLGVTGP